MSESTQFFEHPFIRTLRTEQAWALYECATPRALAREQLVFSEGQLADRFYLVSSGRIALEEHVPSACPSRVETLEAGDLLGLSWLMEAAWTLDARCVVDSELFELDARCVRAKMGADDALAIELLNHIITALYQRLTRVRLQRLDIYSRRR